jgi:hypothetical protein
VNPDAVSLLVAAAWARAGPVSALVGSPPVRVSSSVTRPGVVSVMVAWKVTWFIGWFHTTWMSNAVNSSAWRCSGSPSRRPASSGSSSSRSMSLTCRLSLARAARSASMVSRWWCRSVKWAWMRVRMACAVFTPGQWQRFAAQIKTGHSGTA